MTAPACAPVCPVCERPAALTTGAVIYPKIPRLADKPIWRCELCPDRYVGCHPGTVVPLGFPADAELRKARSLLHEQRIDPIWQNADRDGGYDPLDAEGLKVVRRAARVRVYRFLAERLGISPDDCHTGQFDLDRCRAAWRALRGVTYREVRQWATHGNPSPKPKKRKPKEKPE